MGDQCRAVRFRRPQELHGQWKAVCERPVRDVAVHIRLEIDKRSGVGQAPTQTLAGEAEQTPAAPMRHIENTSSSLLERPLRHIE